MIKISNHIIKKNSKTLIIAEIGQSHHGSLSKAKEIIKKVAKTGVEFIKFQTHYANEESTIDEPFRIKISNFKNRIDYWKKMEFTTEEWRAIKTECEKNKLVFLSSPFSEKAVDVLKKIEMKAWKIGSGEFFSNHLLKKIKQFHQPIILSTGLSTLNDISSILKKLDKNKIILMQCTSMYPCRLEHIGINMIDVFKKRFKCFVGLSDHSGSIYPAIYAMTKGASLVEVHVGDKNDIKNPDHSSSLEFDDLLELVKARDIIFSLKKNPVKKTNLNYKLKKYKKIFTKSCALKISKKKGELIKKSDITFKKPGTGIPEHKIDMLFNKKLKKNVSNNRLLRKSDF